ncbi:MAG: SRPBCC family protein [Bacteroidota bacterium]
MPSILTEISHEINVPPQILYDILVDYQSSHPAILPKPYFESLSVTKGGRGAGTAFDLTMRVMGMRQQFQMEVSEPIRGSVIKEIDKAKGVETTFTLESIARGRSCKLTIATEAPASKGIKGWLERKITPRVTRKIFEAQMVLIEAQAKRVLNPS